MSLKKIDVNASITCPYKNKEILKDEKSKTKFFSPYYRHLSDDWTSWYTISEESRKSDYKKTRKYWKNRFFEEEISALHFAVENEDIDIVKLLLNDANIDVNKVYIAIKTFFL